MAPLVECHAHVLPDAALARFPDGASARYVTAERREAVRWRNAARLFGLESRSLVLSPP